MADRMRTSLVCQAIDMAVRRCPFERGVTIFHSDREVSTRLRGSWTASTPMGFVPRWSVRGCAGTMLGRSRSKPHSRMRGSIGWYTPRRIKRLFVFGGVVGGACRLVEVVVVRWSLRRLVWMRLRMV